MDSRRPGPKPSPTSTETGARMSRKIEASSAKVRQARGECSSTAHPDAAQCILVDVSDRNVLGGELEPCGVDPVTGFYRDGSCATGPQDVGSHTVCAVMTREFLEHQQRIGNNLTTAMPQYRFPGLVPGDRWCVTAVNWLQAHNDGVAAPVVLASTHERALDLVPLPALREHAVDVPGDPSALET